MPIYMDRHDVSPSVTAESVARMHKEDLKIQDQFGCKGLTYWFDEKRNTAFCLVEAPDAGAIRKMHRNAHGEVPNQIIKVDIGIVDAFLGRIQDPEKAGNDLHVIREPAFRIIMIIHMEKQFPFRTASEDHIASFERFTQKVVEALDSYDGNIVARSAYHFLVSFVSVTHAVHAASDIQSFFRKFNKRQGLPFRIRIGLNAGQPVTDKPALFEEKIKSTEKMCEVVGGEVIISSEVRSEYEKENMAFAKTEDTVFLTREDEDFILLFTDYVAAHWDDAHLKVADFCKPLHCSKSQLYRKITALTGRSLHGFLKEYRLNRAAHLLMNGVKNIGEIAFSTGFTSPSYFSKCFQKRYRRMPSQFLSLG